MPGQCIEVGTVLFDVVTDCQLIIAAPAACATANVMRPSVVTYRAVGLA
jgi:hypothetical protein